MDNIFSLIRMTAKVVSSAKGKMSAVKNIPVMGPNAWEGNITNLSVNGQNGFDADGRLIDPGKLFDSFNDGKQATHYQFSVIVDQPGAIGPPEDYLPVRENGGGHTSFVLEKINTDNSASSATLGFYPESIKDILLGRGMIMNDADSPHVNELRDVGRSFKINEQQFNGVKEYITGNFQNKYDLITYNCTDFAIEAAKAGGVSIPSNLIHNNPAGLGSAMKAM